MRKKTREGKGAVNNEMWNISGGKRRPCCGYGSEKVMSKGHYLQLLKRKYKFTYKQKNRGKKFREKQRQRQVECFRGQTTTHCVARSGREKAVSKVKRAICRWRIQDIQRQENTETGSKVKRAICRWQIQDKDKV